MPTIVIILIPSIRSKSQNVWENYRMNDLHPILIPSIRSKSQNPSVSEMMRCVVNILIPSIRSKSQNTLPNSTERKVSSSGGLNPFYQV